MKFNATFTRQELVFAKILADDPGVCWAIDCDCDMDWYHCPLASLEKEEALKYIEDHLEEES